MSKLTKTMLAVAVLNLACAVLFLTDLVDVSGSPGLYLAFPLAVVFFGLFLISWLLQKEVAAYDAEQRVHRNPAAPAKPAQGQESVHDLQAQSPSNA